MSISARRGLRVAAFLAVPMVAAACLGATQPGSGSSPAEHPVLAAPVKAALAHVIVQSRGDGSRAATAVAQVGGEVTRALPLVDGVAATVPAGSLASLTARRGLIVSPDLPVRVQASASSSSATASVYRKVVGAETLNAGGYTGTGVTVALIDTGVSAVPDLAGTVVPVRDGMTGAVKACVNLSGEKDCTDTYGHGTFMAGIIAGSGASSGGTYKGMAPGARILSLKIAGKDGAADVSTVLAAVQWVVSFREEYGIRVLNLSLGTNSTQSFRTDPLNYAVERAWDSGVAVVVAAANLGPGAGTISKPADDPWVITVGAIDDRGTPGLGDDSLPNFSSRGPTAADGLAKPDVVAPGAHIVSLVAPGSAINTAYPSTLGGGYRKGSGTSMAAAVVSGAAALLVQADPSVTPDRLKYALTATTGPTGSNDPMEVGSGIVQADKARTAPEGTANQGLERSNGMGSLDASRGTVRVRTLGSDGLLGTTLGTVISGSMTAQLLLWDPIGFATGTWTDDTWYLSSYYLFGWQAVTWDGGKWQGGKWQGGKWQGVEDTASTYGGKWQGSAWYGAWE
ncbi:MAG TPA: S8 family serine peptidase [Acidimicrobiales bacterium]|nr:S8 family serine peptidase [Acidimicrobiales bacterium]